MSLIKYTFTILSFLLIAQFTMAETLHVDIVKFKFAPQQLTVNAGDTVIWTNKEKRQFHSVWFKTLMPEEPDYFFPDETYQRTFPEKGTFEYECGPHPDMKGSIVVK